MALGIERVSVRTGLGMALSFVGIALALQVRFDQAEWVGVGLALLGAVAWTGGVLAMRRLLPARDARVYLFWIVLTAAVTFLLGTAASGGFDPPAGLRGWIGLVGTPVCYSVGIIGFYVASATIGATRTSYYMNFEPIATIFLAAVILDQHLSAVPMAGAALVVAALFLYQSPRAKPAAAPEAGAGRRT